jgi:DNA primase
MSAALDKYFAAKVTTSSLQIIPEHVLDDIKDVLQPSELIGRYVALKKVGHEYRGLSPFRNERTPSFYVHDGKRRWFDFSADTNGDIFEFVMQIECLTFPEAVRRCAEIAGITIEPGRKATTPASPELAAAREERRAIEIAERRESERKATNNAKAIFSQSTGVAMGDSSPVARFLESRGLVCCPLAPARQRSAIARPVPSGKTTASSPPTRR